MKKTLLSAALAVSVMSLIAVPVEAASKKQAHTVCLPNSLQLVLTVIATVNKKTAPCIIPITKKRK